MTLKIYNTLTRKKEIFKPFNDKKVKMFVCGPTVYSYIHAGNAKTFVQFDAIAKYLRYKGYNLTYIQNVTDIDDKIIRKAEEEKTTWKEISNKYTKLFLEDAKNLGISAVDNYPRATDYIPEIISQVQRLIKKGFAYKISDGYYYDLSKFLDYGKLAKRISTEGEDAQSRIDENTEKKNKGDFCLWKFSKPGEPVWKSELNSGRPGWHLEDTAITEKELGQQYDIHGGAIDLILPHHEAEIAQMEAISGKKPFVKYWLHAGFLQINKERMGKSKGNFTIAHELLKNYTKQTIRFFFLSAHYRKPLDFTEQSLEQAKHSLQRIHDFVRSLEHHSTGEENKKISSLIKKLEKDFETAMDDDFESGKSLTIIFEFIREINSLLGQGKLSEKNAQTVLTTFKKIDTVFGILEEKEAIPREVKELVDKREQARTTKNWKEADRLRDEIKDLGYTTDDTKEGIIIKKL
ncbi:MAG: cysteine--tRNA ligase [Candidatus Nanoarchaeia archaeon]